MTKPDDETLARLRVRIAELCGGTVFGEDFNIVEDRRVPTIAWPDTDGPCWCPDYTDDMNAVHEATRTLSIWNRELCMCKLVDLIEPSRIEGYDPEINGAPTLSWDGLAAVAMAEAWQWCIALDRTLSKEPIV